MHLKKKVFIRFTFPEQNNESFREKNDTNNKYEILNKFNIY